VWAYGFRNPFRLTLRPGSDLPYVSDNGDRQYEEINVVRRGINAGWPCYEGRERVQAYRDTRLCQKIYRRGGVIAPPRLGLRRGQSAIIVGGDFERGNRFPTAYRGAYFFADWAYGWLDYLPREQAAPSNTATVRFAEQLPGPVAIRFGPDGRLYYLSYTRGELRRIDYVG
jgi:glucose/arabinose dehydrogenase